MLGTILCLIFLGLTIFWFFSLISNSVDSDYSVKDWERSIIKLRSKIFNTISTLFNLEQFGNVAIRREDGYSISADFNCEYIGVTDYTNTLETCWSHFIDRDNNPTGVDPELWIAKELDLLRGMKTMREVSDN